MKGRSQLPQLADVEARVLFFPPIERRLRHAELPADVDHRRPALRLPQCLENLLRRELALPHAWPPLVPESLASIRHAVKTGPRPDSDPGTQAHITGLTEPLVQPWGSGQLRKLSPPGVSKSLTGSAVRPLPSCWFSCTTSARKLGRVRRPRNRVNSKSDALSSGSHTGSLLDSPLQCFWCQHSRWQPHSSVGNLQLAAPRYRTCTNTSNVCDDADSGSPA